jgi:hypothetical protein
LRDIETKREREQFKELHVEILRVEDKGRERKKYNEMKQIYIYSFTTIHA